MNLRKQFRFVTPGHQALLIASILAFWLVPPASAQGTVVISGAVDNLHVSPNDILFFGYEVAVTDSDPTSTTVSVTNTTVQLSVSCPNGGSQIITLNVPTQSFMVPAHTTNWFPSDNIYQGQTAMPPTLCGGKAGTETALTFKTNFTYTCKSGFGQDCCHKVCFRMRHKHNRENPCSFRDYCEPSKQCTSPEKHGCCKQNE
jgi:hypothetical protein